MNENILVDVSTLISKLRKLGKNNIVARLCREHWNHVLELLDNKKPYPIVWEINPSSSCNLNCNFCLYSKGKENISVEHFKKVIRQVCAIGGKSIIIAGDGEPLLHPDIEEMLEYAYDMKLNITLFTNATLIGKSIDAEQICKYCNHIIVGIYGYDVDSYRHTTKSNEFSAFLKGIKALTDVKSKSNVSGLSIVGGWVATGANVKDVENVVEFCYNLDFDWVFLRPDVTSITFNSVNEIEYLKGKFDKLRFEYNVGEKEFVVSRILFDRSNKDSRILLLDEYDELYQKYGSTDLALFDTYYISPDGVVRTGLKRKENVIYNKELSSYVESLSTIVEYYHNQSDKIADKEIVLNGRKKIISVFYGILSKVEKSDRAKIRNMILEAFKEDEYSSSVSNYI